MFITLMLICAPHMCFVVRRNDEAIYSDEDNIYLIGPPPRYTTYYSVCLAKGVIFNALADSCIKYKNNTHFIRVIFENINLTSFG